MDATLVSTPVTHSAVNLQPKEHGAYAILGFPIATALVIAGPTVPGVCIAVAAVAGFLAHEPLLVAWGHRGERAQRSAPTAKKQLAILLFLTIVGGSLAMWIGSATVRTSLLVCIVLAATSFLLAGIGKHRTLGGQLWGVAGLSIPCIPILLAGSVSPALAIEAWTTWLVGFIATTMAVRGVIASQKRNPRTVHWLVIGLLSFLIVVLAFNEGALAITALPMIAMSWYLMIHPPPAKHLKRVGWTLVVGTVATAVWMAYCFAGVAN